MILVSVENCGKQFCTLPIAGNCFQLIEGDRFAVQSRKKGVPLTEVLKNEPSVDRTLALIDAFLSTVPEEVAGQTTFDYSMDYTTYLLEDNTTAAESEEVARS